MGSVTKATPIQFINGKSHKKKWRDCKTALSGYYTYLSRDLLVIASKADTHTHTHTHIHQHSWTKRFQETRCAGLQLACAWIKNSKIELQM